MAELTRRRQALLLVALFMAALAIRLYRLDGQSFWNDEGTSVALAARSLATITRDASHDIHPPLYYYLLHFWTLAFGNSEVAVRALSALLGALVVPLTYLLGVQLYGWKPGLVAALVATASPLAVYYSQEARMYILMTALGALSFLLFLHWIAALRDGAAPFAAPRGLLIGYAVATALMLYSHYFAATLIVAQNLIFCVAWAAKGHSLRSKDTGAWTWLRKPLLQWALAQTGVLAAFAPWLFVVRDQLRNWPAVSEPFTLGQLATRVLHVYGLGITVEGMGAYALALGALGVIGWGVWSASGSRQENAAALRWSGLANGAYLLLPPLLMYVLSLRRPMYNPKFLLLATPAYALALGRALILPAGVHKALRGLWLVAALGSVALLAGASLRNYFFDPRYARDDYRGMAAYIEAAGTSSDAILINAPGQYETFVYYYHGISPIYPLPRQRPIDTTQTEADLQAMIEGRQHIYAIFWATDESDPDRFIESWLDQHAYKASDSWHGNVRLAVYALPEADASSASPVSVGARFGDSILLQDYALLTPNPESGDIMQISLRWEALARLGARYKVFAQLLDSQNMIVGQRDSEPSGGARLTTSWAPGDVIEDNLGVPILAGVPPGAYRLIVGLYDMDTGQRLPAAKGGEAAGDHLELGLVNVRLASAPPPVAALHMQHEEQISGDTLALLGYNLARLGADDQTDAPIHAGDVLHLTLFWQAKAQLPGDLEVLIRLTDAKGKVWLEERTPPAGGSYPASQWNTGEIVRDQHVLFLPPDSAGSFQVWVGAYQASGSELVSVHLLQKVRIE